VKRTHVLVTLLVAIALLTTSCGTGDKIASVSITANGNTGTINLAGLGGTLQLKVLANYTSGKWIDETNFSTYTVTAGLLHRLQHQPSDRDSSGQPAADGDHQPDWHGYSRRSSCLHLGESGNAAGARLGLHRRLQDRCDVPGLRIAAHLHPGRFRGQRSGQYQRPVRPDVIACAGPFTSPATVDS